MAKGEGGEQYSNASLLNKPVSPDGISLARKVSLSRIFFLIFCFKKHIFTSSSQTWPWLGI